MQLKKAAVRTAQGLPLPVVTLILATFLAIRQMYGSVHPASLIPSGITFLLLFVLLRLIDDIDDGPRPVPAGPVVLLVVLAAAVIALNVADGRALAGAAVAVAAMAAVPFVLRGRIPQPLLIIAYETVPALIMFYGSVSAAGMPDWLTWLAVTALFWSGFEIWKWSREADRSGSPRPHGLSQTAVRVWVIAAYVLACAAIGVVSGSLPRASWLLWYGPPAVAVSAGLTVACWKAPPRPIGWRGLVLITMVDFGVFIQAIVAAVA